MRAADKVVLATLVTMLTLMVWLAVDTAHGRDCALGPRPGTWVGFYGLGGHCERAP